MEAVQGSQLDRCGYPLSGLPREPPGVRVPLQLHHRRPGQHSPVHSSSVVGDPWRPDSHLPTPAPPPPLLTERSLEWCALWGPPFTRAVAPPPRPRARAGSRAGQRSARPGAPPPAVPQRRGRRVQSTTTPPVPRAVRRCGPPPVVRPGSAPPCLMQSWGRWQHVNDREAACPDRTLPRRAQRQAPMASLPGPGAPGITQPPTRRRKRAGPGAAQPCDPSCPTSATGMHAPPTCPARATHTGTAASPSRVCHHGVRGRSTVRQALGPDNRDSPSPVVSAQRRVLSVGQGVRHRPWPKPNQTPPCTSAASVLRNMGPPNTSCPACPCAADRLCPGRYWRGGFRVRG